MKKLVSKSKKIQIKTAKHQTGPETELGERKVRKENKRGRREKQEGTITF